MTQINNNFKNATVKIVSEALVLAAKNRDLMAANYLLNSPDIKNKPNLREDGFGALRYAVYNNDLDILKLLINSNSFKEDKKGQDALNYSLSIACFYGHLESVKFLLTSPDLPYYPDIAHKDNESLSLAISTGSVDVVKFLLGSSELKIKANIFSKKWDVISRCFNVNEKANEQILKFLVFDLNIPKDNNIDKIIKRNPDCALVKYFEVRDLHNSLDVLEQKNQTTTKKFKI